MKILTKTHLALLCFVVITLCAQSTHAVVFVNMDKAGGDDAKEAQKQTATAAAMFLTSGSITFEMYAEIEYLIGGAQKPDNELPSIENAANLCGKAIEQLDTAIKTFKSLKDQKYGRAVASIDLAIDNKIKNRGFLEKIFIDASINPKHPTVIRVLGAYNTNRTLGVIDIAIKEMEKVLKIMQSILEELNNNRIPQAKTLWQSSFDWGRALHTGRAIAALFKVQ